ncbi:unnamed protein product [Echinostoma caproni]|uniref:Tetraspanin n=1 Tax=Echinostoma caproni TaxID=27848 RepID=A0A183ACT3_9TREM|nr:unnamed protein product [Echinostoma caproni]
MSPAVDSVPEDEVHLFHLTRQLSMNQSAERMDLARRRLNRATHLARMAKETVDDIVEQVYRSATPSNPRTDICETLDCHNTITEQFRIKCFSHYQLAGIGLLVVSVTLTDVLYKYTDPFDTGLGPIAVAVGILGCFILAAAVFGAAAMFTDSILLLHIIKRTATNVLLKYFSMMSQNAYYKYLVERLESDMKCCGIRGYLDYERQPIPESCYNDHHVHLDGCLVKLNEILERYMRILCGITFAALIPEAMAIFTAFCYRRCSSKNEEEDEDEEEHN